MSSLFTVAGDETVNLDDLASQLREEISHLPPEDPQLAKRQLAAQAGVVEFLVVVRGHENPHTHPDQDLVIVVLEGGGYVWLTAGPAQAPAGSTVVIPKGVCHAYYNTSPSDSVLFATFSPAEGRAPAPCADPGSGVHAPGASATAPASFQAG